MKKVICSDNWADILLDDLEKLGHPVIQHTTLSTQEFNELCALSFDQSMNREWADCPQASEYEQRYPIIEVIPLTKEEFNQALWEAFGLDQRPALTVQIPDVVKPVVLSKVS